MYKLQLPLPLRQAALHFFCTPYAVHMLYCIHNYTCTLCTACPCTRRPCTSTPLHTACLHNCNVQLPLPLRQAALHFFAGEPLLMSAGADNAVKHWVFDSAEPAARLLRFRSGHAAPPTSVVHYGEVRAGV